MNTIKPAYDLSNLSLCACMGLRYDETYCHCEMQRKMLPRSEKWKEAHSPAALKEQKEKFYNALTRMVELDKIQLTDTGV